MRTRGQQILESPEDRQEKRKKLNLRNTVSPQSARGESRAKSGISAKEAADNARSNGRWAHEEHERFLEGKNSLFILIIFNSTFYVWKRLEDG